MSGDDRYCKEWVQRAEWTSHCPCANYRPVLDWPDAPGLWWCDQQCVAEAVRNGVGDIVVDIHACWLSHHDFLEGFGPARFVRMLETNPFGDTQP